jgi:hypothetical protein
MPDVHEMAHEEWLAWLLPARRPRREVACIPSSVVRVHQTTPTPWITTNPPRCRLSLLRQGRPGAAANCRAAAAGRAQQRRSSAEEAAPPPPAGHRGGQGAGPTRPAEPPTRIAESLPDAASRQAGAAAGSRPARPQLDQAGGLVQHVRLLPRLLGLSGAEQAQHGLPVHLPARGAGARAGAAGACFGPRSAHTCTCCWCCARQHPSAPAARASRT